MRHEARTSRSLRSVLRRGFSLVELLVVISVIVIVSAALLPAFGRLVESNNYASAVNAVTATLGSARSIALSTGKRTGVMFLWDAKLEQASLLVVTEGPRERGALGTLASSGRIDHLAEVLWPAPLQVPVELPRGVGVYGLSSSVDSRDIPNSGQFWNQPLFTAPVNMYRWYAGEVVNGDNIDPNDNITLWLFPRNDPRLYTPADSTRRIGLDPWPQIRGESGTGVTQSEALSAIRHSQSFLVLFSAEGTLVTPRRSGGDEVYNYYLEYPSDPLDPQDPSVDPQPYDEPDRFDPENVGSVPPDIDRRQVNAEVMMRAVQQVAVVDLNRMTEGVGLNRPWLARAENSVVPAPAWLTAPEDFVDDDKVRSVSRWIDLNAEIISFNRFTGNAMKRSLQ